MGIWTWAYNLGMIANAFEKNPENMKNRQQLSFFSAEPYIFLSNNRWNISQTIFLNIFISDFGFWTY